MSLKIYRPLHKRCKYCNIEYTTTQQVFMVRDRSFCSEDHRDLFMEEQIPEIIEMSRINNTKINNFLKKSPSLVSTTSLQEFFEVRKTTNKFCHCIIM